MSGFGDFLTQIGGSMPTNPFTPTGVQGMPQGLQLQEMNPNGFPDDLNPMLTGGLSGAMKKLSPVLMMMGQKQPMQPMGPSMPRPSQQPTQQSFPSIKMPGPATPGFNPVASKYGMSDQDVQQILLMLRNGRRI